MLETDDTVLYLKLYVLIYADDTILLCENAKNLQSSIDAMYEYCNLWTLQVHIQKSKVIIKSRGKVRRYPEFKYGVNNLEVVDNYVYLGMK